MQCQALASLSVARIGRIDLSFASLSCDVWLDSGFEVKYPCCPTTWILCNRYSFISVTQAVSMTCLLCSIYCGHHQYKWHFVLSVVVLPMLSATLLISHGWISVLDLLLAVIFLTNNNDLSFRFVDQVIVCDLTVRIIRSIASQRQGGQYWAYVSKETCKTSYKKKEIRWVGQTAVQIGQRTISYVASFQLC